MASQENSEELSLEEMKAREEAVDVEELADDGGGWVDAGAPDERDDAMTRRVNAIREKYRPHREKYLRPGEKFD